MSQELLPRGVRRGADGLLEYVDQADSIVEILRRAVDSAPDREAVVVPGGERLTYRELAARAQSAASGLMEAGLRPGDRVGIDLPNGIEWVVAYWAGHLAGCVVVPLNSRLNEADKQRQITHVGCALVLDDPSSLPVGAGEFTAPPTTDSFAIAEIFYTSGTTGEPKGVAMSHRNLWTAAENTRHMLAEAMTNVEGHRNLISVPLFHVTGCHSQLLATTHTMGTCVIMPSFDVEEFLRLLGDEQINQTISVPTIYWRAVHHPAASAALTETVESVMYGGAPVPSDLIPALRTMFPHAALVNGFGCTESTGVLSALPDRFALSHLSAIGLPMPTVEVELREPDTTGAGEMFVRGASMMTGYWNGVEAVPTDEQWISTGDIVRRDGDGVHWIVDRVKDVISRGGEKIFSVEVENVMIGAPGVFEVALIGVPDRDLGERPGLVVWADDVAVDPATVAEHARARLPVFQRPEFIHVATEPLPRNAGGKILKSVLRDEIDWLSAYRPG